MCFGVPVYSNEERDGSMLVIYYYKCSLSRRYQFQNKVFSLTCIQKHTFQFPKDAS